MRILVPLVSILLFVATSSLGAQDDDSLPVPERVEVSAPDDLTLVGDFYVVPNAEGDLPSVLLLHGILSDRHAWLPLVGPMLENGFNVLTVDQRAYGETGGDRDLVAAIDDVGVWLDWLRQQPFVKDDSISTIGSSWGTVPALAGCSADAACLTAIVLSPGDFPLLDEAMFDALSERSALIIIGRDDNSFYDANKLFDRASGEISMQVYNTGAHGNAFISPRSAYRERVIDLILYWLNDHIEWAQTRD